MTTPQEARELAEHYADTTLVKPALRSLAAQVEALTAELESYKAELTRIANADLKTWYSENNTPADFMAWAQSSARAAIAKGTA